MFDVRIHYLIELLGKLGTGISVANYGLWSLLEIYKLIGMVFVNELENEK